MDKLRVKLFVYISESRYSVFRAYETEKAPKTLP